MVTRVDSTEWRRVAARIAELAESTVLKSPTLTFIAGRIRATEGQSEEALSLFTHALSLRPIDKMLAARLGFELGSLHIARGELLTATMVVAAAEAVVRQTPTRWADLLHIRALLAEARGQPTRALGLYRAAIRNSDRSLTRLTLVLALRNLAAGVAHSDPAESLALLEHALAVVDAAELDPRIKPSLQNVRAYSLVCLGRFDDAAATAGAIAEDSADEKAGHTTLYGRFNLSIADELRGRFAEATTALEHLRRDAHLAKAPELASWATLRLSWLRFRVGDPLGANALLREGFREPVGEPFSRGVTTLQALIAFSQGRAGECDRTLRTLAASYVAEGDALTAYVLMLWRTHVLDAVGRPVASRRALRAAHELTVGRSFRVSPNWWHPAIIRTAQKIADGAVSDYFENVPTPESTPLLPASLPSVHVSSDHVRVGERPVGDDLWRGGKAGAGVLRRYFALLVSFRSSGIARDELIDRLWPESDGDRALKNLHAATRDLRRVLLSMPGLRLVADDRHYRLESDGNVTFGR